LTCPPTLTISLPLRAGFAGTADAVGVAVCRGAGLGDALAVDMESYWLARSAGDRPVAVVRAVVDRAGRRLLDPRTLPAGIRGLLALREAAPVLRAWKPVESGP
jgi:hypothetical protein